MARVSLVIAFILGFSTCLNLALSVPLEDVVVDGDTVILDGKNKFILTRTVFYLF
jgi:hypothetical protein